MLSYILMTAIMCMKLFTFSTCTRSGSPYNYSSSIMCDAICDSIQRQTTTGTGKAARSWKRSGEIGD